MCFIQKENHCYVWHRAVAASPVVQNRLTAKIAIVSEGDVAL